MAFHVASIGKEKRVPRFSFNMMTGMTIPYLLVLFVFVLLPFFFIVLYSFLQKDNSVLYLTLENFSGFVTNVNFLRAAGLSLWFAFITTVICVLLGFPMAYFIGRSRPRVRSLLITAVTVPMWINMLLRVMAWQQIFTTITSWTGIELVGTDFAIIFAMVYVFLPFMIIPIYTSIVKIDPAFYEASKDLGADSFMTFLHVTVPLSMPGVISGITMVFLPAATSLVIPAKLGHGSSRYYLIGQLIESYFVTGNNYYFGSAIAVLLSLTMLLMMYAVNKLDRSNVVDREKSVKKSGLNLKGNGGAAR